MIPLTLYSDIEESTLALCKGVVKKFVEKRVLFEREGRGISPTNSSAAPTQAHRPEIDVAIIEGTTSKEGTRGYKDTLDVYVTVVSTSSKSETARRNELYPILTAVKNRLLRTRLKKNGEFLPVSALEPSPVKWGQSAIDGENGFLSYTVVFQTVFSWTLQDGEPDEDYENLPWFEGIDMLFDKMPENKEVLQAKVEV